MDFPGFSFDGPRRCPVDQFGAFEAFEQCTRSLFAKIKVVCKGTNAGDGSL